MDMNQAIQAMTNLKDRHITYSMYGSRTGNDGTADCSGAVYHALRAAGGYNLGWVPNTDSLHAYLVNLGFQLVADNSDWNMQRGDVVIWGTKGASGGAAGHTGICIDNQNWIECTAWSGGGNGSNGGVIISNHDSRLAMNGYPHWYAYRLKSTPKPAPTPKAPTGWIAEKGNFKSNTAINLRKQDNTSGSIITKLPAGSVVKYDAYRIDANGFVWIRQPRSGGYGYLATGESKNGKRVSYWGSFY